MTCRCDKNLIIQHKNSEKHNENHEIKSGNVSTFAAKPALNLEVDSKLYPQATISLNLKPRHLDIAQHVMVASRLANMQQGARTDLVEISTMSQTDAANLLNVSRESVVSAQISIKIRKN